MRLLTLALCLLLPALVATGSDVREPAAGVGIDQHPGQRIPLDTVLRDSRGSPRRIGDLLNDRPLLLALGYHRCEHLCDPLAKGIERSLANTGLTAGEDVNVAFVSIDPREQAVDAAAHRERTLGGPRRGWYFLTASPESAAVLAETVGFRYRPDSGSDQIAHPAGITIITPEGRISSYLFGVDFDPKTLRLKLVDAADGGLGSPTDQLLLLCLHYDPESGRYNLAVMQVLRMAGLASVVALGFGVAVLRRRRND